MKIINITLLTLLLTLGFGTASYADDHAEKIEMSKGIHDVAGTMVNIKVNGLVCDFCARAVEKVFMKQDEVAGVNVNLGDHLVQVSLKEGRTISDKELTELINDSGYALVEINRMAPDAK